MSDVKVNFTGVPQMMGRMQTYQGRVLFAVEQVANYFAVVFEQQAKQNAPWQDRTANARQNLHAWVEVASEIVTLYLSHGVDYGLYLEVGFAGRYAVIMPTIEAHLDAIRKMLQGIFG